MTPTEVLPAPIVDADEKDSVWHQAFTLAERVQDGLPGKCGDTAVAQRRLLRWKEALLFSQDESLYQKCLAQYGLSEDELKNLLSESAEEFAARSDPPEWLEHLLDVYKRAAEAPQSAEELSQKALPEFGLLIAPLVLAAQERLHEGVQKLTGTSTKAPWDAATVEKVLFANLPAQV